MPLLWSKLIFKNITSGEDDCSLAFFPAIVHNLPVVLAVALHFQAFWRYFKLSHVDVLLSISCRNVKRQLAKLKRKTYVVTVTILVKAYTVITRTMSYTDDGVSRRDDVWAPVSLSTSCGFSNDRVGRFLRWIVDRSHHRYVLAVW